jgi:hypothetical protein
VVRGWLYPHQGSNPRFDICVSHKRRNILSVRGDIPVDSEAHVVTLSISRPDPPAQSFRDAHRVYAQSFRDAQFQELVVAERDDLHDLRMSQA